MLKSKLLLASSKLESVKSKNKSEAGKGEGVGISRWKYMMVRNSLDKTIESLERWQRIFDPSWLLMLRVADGVIDSELSNSAQAPVSEVARGDGGGGSKLAAAQKLRVSIRGDASDIHVSLPVDGLDLATAVNIAHSETKLIRRAGGSSKLFAVDAIAFAQNTNPARARFDAEALAKKLKHVEYGGGVLPCHGLIKRRDAATKRLSSIDLVFAIPPQLTEHQPRPQTLRSALQAGAMPARTSLSAVLGVARQLAEAVSFLHTCDFVHKNVRPETVLLFNQELDPAGKWRDSEMGSAYLVGFDSFRGAMSHTARKGDNDWRRDLYRHPSRQGLLAHDNYIMQHDVYSLGVCLLELGVGRSFIEYSEAKGEQQLRARPSDVLLDVTAVDKEADKDGAVPATNKAMLQQHPGLGLSASSGLFSASDAQRGGVGLKDHLVRLAKARLPARMGDLYTAVVVTCLTCLDRDNGDFGDEEDICDEDGILIGVRFIERVLLRLNNISV
ncbi:hypothetical protein RB598_001343 [Gaeumannomyces tritici]